MIADGQAMTERSQRRRRCVASSASAANVAAESSADNQVTLSPLSTSSPLLLRLVHRRDTCQRDCANKTNASCISNNNGISNGDNKPSNFKTSSKRALYGFSPFAMSIAVLAAILMSSSTFSSVNADNTDIVIPDGAFADEPPVVTATISPLTCPQGCSCFFTLMFCYNINRIPAVISPATKFVSISNAQFVNPVLTRNNFSSGYENIEDISIQYTNLAVVQSQAFDNLRRVRYISLDHNQLRALPSSMLRVFARAKFVSLFSNLWTCNKDLAWLYEVYRSNPDKFGAGCLDTDCRTVSQVRCDAPLNFRNLDFVNITFAQYQQMQTA